mgnify:CR=1 FL=1
MAERKGILFIDINEPLMDDHGDLKAEYSIDGIHFYGDGYATLMPLLLPIFIRSCNGWLSNLSI